MAMGGGGGGGADCGWRWEIPVPTPTLYEILVWLPTTESTKDCQWADSTCSRHGLETPSIVAYFSKHN